MKLTHQVHIKTVLDVIELMSIAGWIALLADLIWVVRDSIVSDFPLSLLPVFTLLLIAFIIMSVGVVLYHKRQSETMLRVLMRERLAICKRKYKHKDGV